jgi:hypothetical protein
MADNVTDTSIDGGSGYPAADYTGYPHGAQGSDDAGLNTGVFQGVLPPGDRLKDYGTDYPFPDAFPRTSTATEFGSGSSGAPDTQTDEAGQMAAYQQGVTDIFGQVRPSMSPMTAGLKLELEEPQ